MNIGKIIKELHKKHNWSQCELANKTNIILSIEAAKSVADVFGVSLDYPPVREGINASFRKRYNTYAP